MSGSSIGGAKAAATNKAKYGEDFYIRAGKLGGSAKTTKLKGFAADRELARTAGAKGGRISRRTGVKNGQAKNKPEYIDASRSAWIKKLFRRYA